MTQHVISEEAMVSIPKRVVDWMIPEKFVKSFILTLQQQTEENNYAPTHKSVFWQLNEEFYTYFGYYRYANYNSFKVTFYHFHPQKRREPSRQLKLQF